MTNAQIIFNASIDLMNNGIIKGTGRIFEFVDDAGNAHTLEEPEAIHTFATWQQLGRQVKKGEKCKARIDIWKQGATRTAVNDETGEEEEKPGKMFMKTAYFFTYDQTEEAKPKQPKQAKQ